MVLLQNSGNLVTTILGKAAVNKALEDLAVKYTIFSSEEGNRCHQRLVLWLIISYIYFWILTDAS